MVRAQTPASAADGSGRRLTLTAGYEIHRDRLRYEFENPSNIDTPFLVRHTYAQTYIADNQWLVASARYRLWGEHLETEVGFTPEVTTWGTDFDTFYDPNDDIVVSGTAGDVRLRSQRFAEWSEGRLWGMPFRLGYTYRRDRSDFLPADVVLTHTNPPSEVRRLTLDREQTVSQVHSFPVDLARHLTLPHGWTLVSGATVSPFVLARLTTRLPDKYPGQDLVSDAMVVELEGRVQFVRAEGRWPVFLGMKYGSTVSYTASRQFRRNGAQLSVRVGYRP